MKNHLLEAKTVTKYYGKKLVLKDLDLYADAGEIIGIIGPNGAGKSTLLRALSTQIVPDSGSIFFQGRDINKNRKQSLSQLGFMPSIENSFFPRIKGRENLELFARLNGIRKKEFQERIAPWMELPSLRNAMDTRYVFCSTGMKQILSLCRAMIHTPRLVLLDEPMKSVDEKTTEHIISVIKEKVHETGCTVIFVSHIRAVIDKLATRKLYLNEGKLALSSQ